MKTFSITSASGFKLNGKPGYNGITIEGGDDIEVRDEYHSMHELYEHRMALSIALFNYYYIVDISVRGDYIAGGSNHIVMKSKLHNDGTMFEGYFIVMMITPAGQISYHYKLKHWNKFRIPEVERTPAWDGHTSLEVMERLMKL